MPRRPSFARLRESAAYDLETGVAAFRSSQAAAAPEPEQQEAEPERGPEERWFLALGSKIVGVQHYTGLVSDGEKVVLRREPSNVYDRNAIQVPKSLEVLYPLAFQLPFRKEPLGSVKTSGCKCRLPQHSCEG